MDKAAVESLAMDLHKWYLEAIAQLSPKDFNKKAQISYSELSEGQKHIDRYIATAILEKLPKADWEETGKAMWSNWDYSLNLLTDKNKRIEFADIWEKFQGKKISIQIMEVE